MTCLIIVIISFSILLAHTATGQTDIFLKKLHKALEKITTDNPLFVVMCNKKFKNLYKEIKPERDLMML